MSSTIDGGLPPAKSGAGGSGLLGESLPYLDGDPGRGLPLMSAGSYGVLEAGGLVKSLEPRGEGYERVGDCDDLEDGLKGE